MNEHNECEIAIHTARHDLILTGIRFFDLVLTLGCGQAFRWRLLKNGFWHGIAYGKVLEIRQDEYGLLLKNATLSDYEALWVDYFDLGRDYASLCARLSADQHLKKAVSLYPGIHILKQEPWEVLCSFIISQCNNIPRIQGIIDRLCSCFGEKIGEGDYSFPSADKLVALEAGDLAPIRAGYRSKYILDAARKISSGEVDLDSLASRPINEARSQLAKINGVGNKVAECTLLYGCGRMEAFPVDVWVKRVMDELYPNGLPACANGAQGIAQQYLFHWRRNL